MIPWLVDDLIRSLQSVKPWKFKVVVMPDFFLDRFVIYPGDVETFSKSVAEVAERLGGNIHGVKQTELRGGNAANTASALATLGAKVYPIITTTPLGYNILKFYLDPLGVDLSYVRTDGENALTTAFELVYHGEHVNLMMGDLGSLPNFGPQSLTEKDFQLLQDADYVCVFNWAATSRWGTELAEKVFYYVKDKGKGKTYLDTGDPTPNKKKIPKLIRRVLTKNLIDALGVNENEAEAYAGHFNPKTKRAQKPGQHELAKENARTLAKHFSTRVDLHTSLFAGSFTKDDETIVPTFKVSVMRSTGAGDAWNAGNIFGDAHSFPASCRLTLANAVAAYYVSRPTPEHPTLSKLIEFCSKQQSLQK